MAASLAIFLYPDRVGVSRMKSAGYKPSFAAPMWKQVDDMAVLLTEPVMLASAVRELIGDDKKYDVYLNIWPGAYNTVMFSYAKKGRTDIERLRQSELETVFHGEFSRLHTYDLVLNNGKPTVGDKSRRVIYVVPGDRVNLMTHTFAAQKLNLKRIAPMDAAVAESALKFWNPDKKSISACLMMDDACTSIAFFHNGMIQAIRTLQDGFGTVVKNYQSLTGLSSEMCRQLIRNNGVEITDDTFVVPVLQDEVLRTINRLAVEVVRTLHSTFGEEAVLENVMLCGCFARTVGLADHLNTMLQVDSVVADAASMAGAVSAVVLDEKDFEDLFPLACTAANGADLMFQLKKDKSGKAQSIAVCSFMGAALIALMCVNPVLKNGALKERNAAEALLLREDYVAVRALYDQRSDLVRQKNNLTAAIESLPHGATNTAGLIRDLTDMTINYGSIIGVSVDNNAKTINFSFTTMNYDSFVLWQRAITESGRFSFENPPTFEGNGMIYTVQATLTATDFDTVLEETPDEIAAEEG